MSWMNEIANVLQNYATTTGQPAAPSGDVDNHFQQVAQAAPASDLASGLAAMFHSDQTPPIPQMISQLFGNSNNNQRASLLNTLMSSGAAAGILGQLAQSAGINLPTGAGNSAPITPEAAAQVTPEMVEQAAAHAEQHDPSVIEKLSEFYAQHPTLVKTLGTAALTIAMSHMARRRS